MTDGKFNGLGPLYSEIGAAGSAIVGGDPDGLFIYLEVDEGSVYGAVFKDEGVQVRYYDPSDTLCYLALEAWNEGADGKRWLAMEYDVRGRQFDVHLAYVDEVDPKQDSADRRQAALHRRYGPKPIIYPPIPSHFQELK